MTPVSAMVTHDTDIPIASTPRRSETVSPGNRWEQPRREGNGWVTKPAELRCETSCWSLSQGRSPHNGARKALRTTGN